MKMTGDNWHIENSSLKWAADNLVKNVTMM